MCNTIADTSTSHTEKMSTTKSRPTGKRSRPGKMPSTAADDETNEEVTSTKTKKTKGKRGKTPKRPRTPKRSRTPKQSRTPKTPKTPKTKKSRSRG